MPRKRSDATEDAVAPETGAPEDAVPTPPEEAAPDPEPPAPPREAEPLDEPQQIVGAEPAESIEPGPETGPAVEPLTASWPERPADVEPSPAVEPEQASGIEPVSEPDPERARAVEPLAAPVAAAVEEHAEEHHDDESGPSLASRALAFLVILLGGAALGIWAAPKLAPLLPSGLAPVSAWLTPGQREAEAEIDALEARLDQGLGGMEARLADLAPPTDIDARISGAVEASEGRLNAALASLQQRVDQADGADTRQRLGKLEAAVEGRAAEIDALKEQLAGATAAGGQLSEEAAARIDVYRAELEGLRAEMAALQDKVGALGARIDEVAARADREITTAQSKVDEIQAAAATRLGAAETEAELAVVRAALASGQPFEDALARLAERPGITVPAGLAAAAPTGIATLAQLRDRFPDAAHDAIRASIIAGAGDGVIARSRAFLEAQMASRSLTPKPGMAPDAVLSRMEERLRHDDLDGALAEADELPSEAAGAMADWLGAARLRVGAVEGLAELDRAPAATN